MKQPFSQKVVLRALVCIIVFLSLLAGYFHSKASLAERQLLRLQQVVQPAAQ